MVPCLMSPSCRTRATRRYLSVHWLCRPRKRGYAGLLRRGTCRRALAGIVFLGRLCARLRPLLAPQPPVPQPVSAGMRPVGVAGAAAETDSEQVAFGAGLPRGAAVVAAAGFADRAEAERRGRDAMARRAAQARRCR
ncbi:unnamed protein product [Prorocentrum cordatum]|uniref:Uncharacterized protein n=1 Tax=Prorocentrum cordatum TaxID=2364126 RepID=A0ABN9RYG6_9DINO|nr:unnamed protein product [Polarella glacialis]